MADVSQTAVLADLEPKAPHRRSAVREPSGRLHVGQHRGAPDPNLREILNPPQQVARGRQQPGVADSAPRSRGALEPPDPVVAIVIGHAIRNDRGRIVEKARARHAERLEDVGIGEVGERLPAHAADDVREHHVPAVVVDRLRARCEVETALTGENAKETFVLIASSLVRREQLEQQEHVAQSTRVTQEMTDGQRRAVVGKLVEIFLNRVVDGQVSLLSQQHDARRGELFGDRRRLKDRCRRHWNAQLEARHPKRALVDDPPVLADRDADAWRVRFVLGDEDLVQLRVRSNGAGATGARRGSSGEGQDC